MRRRFLVILAALAAAPELAAQQRDTTAAARGPLFTRGDLVVAGAFTVAALAAAPLDEGFAERSQRYARRNPGSRYGDASDALQHVQEKSLTYAYAAAYLGGRLTGRPGVADVGLHGVEALAVVNVAGTLLKSAIGRVRPNARNVPFSVADAGDFKPFRGFTDSRYRSFPSLHEAGAMAAAAAITTEMGYHRPGAKVAVGIASYTAATAVGLSRLYVNKHWASDLVVGAALGHFAGSTVVHWNHRNPGNRLNRWMLRPSPSGVEVSAAF